MKIITWFTRIFLPHRTPVVSSESDNNTNTTTILEDNHAIQLSERSGEQVIATLENWLTVEPTLDLADRERLRTFTSRILYLATSLSLSLSPKESEPDTNKSPARAPWEAYQARYNQKSSLSLLPDGQGQDKKETLAGQIQANPNDTSGDFYLNDDGEDSAEIYYWVMVQDTPIVKKFKTQVEVQNYLYVKRLSAVVYEGNSVSLVRAKHEEFLEACRRKEDNWPPPGKMKIISIIIAN